MAVEDHRFLPGRFCSARPSNRVMMSGAEPAADGTTILIGLVGPECAQAVGIRAASAGTKNPFFRWLVFQIISTNGDRIALFDIYMVSTTLE